MLFDKITRDLAKGITVLQGEEIREKPRGRRRGCGVSGLPEGGPVFG